MTIERQKYPGWQPPNDTNASGFTVQPGTEHPTYRLAHPELDMSKLHGPGIRIETGLDPDSKDYDRRLKDLMIRLTHAADLLLEVSADRAYPQIGTHHRELGGTLAAELLSGADRPYQLAASHGYIKSGRTVFGDHAVSTGGLHYDSAAMQVVNHGSDLTVGVFQADSQILHGSQVNKFLDILQANKFESGEVQIADPLPYVLPMAEFIGAPFKTPDSFLEDTLQGYATARPDLSFVTVKNVEPPSAGMSTGVTSELRHTSGLGVILTHKMTNLHPRPTEEPDNKKKKKPKKTQEPLPFYTTFIQIIPAVANSNGRLRWFDSRAHPLPPEQWGPAEELALVVKMLQEEIARSRRPPDTLSVEARTGYIL